MSKKARMGRPPTIGASAAMVVKLPGKTLAAIDAWAAAAGISRSEAIRKWIDAGLRRKSRKAST